MPGGSGATLFSLAIKSVAKPPKPTKATTRSPNRNLSPRPPARSGRVIAWHDHVFLHNNSARAFWEEKGRMVWYSGSWFLAAVGGGDCPWRRVLTRARLGRNPARVVPSSAGNEVTQRELQV